MCGGWEGQSSSFDMYQYVNGAWSRIWQKTMSTSCGSTTFSSDSTQVVAGMYLVPIGRSDSLCLSVKHRQPSRFLQRSSSGGCTSGNNNQCGVIYGVTWSLDATHIVTAHGRNDEGVYYWFADIDEDNDGYNTTDQGDGIVDAFPTQGTQWNDTDSDGYGTIPHQLTNPMHVQQPRVRPPKTGTAVLMVTAMDGPMLVIGIRSIPTNGSMQTAMDTETTTSSSSMNTSTMSTSPAMPSPTMRRNGTIPMATVTVTTTKMRIGTNTARLNGQAFV